MNSIEVILKQLDAALEVAGFQARDFIPKPASGLELELYEGFLGFQLPEAIRELYMIQNGEDFRGTSFVFGDVADEILSIQGAIKMASFWREAVAEPGRDSRMKNIGPVRPTLWHSSWIPLLNRDSIWAVDLAPLEQGKVGQIITVAPDDFSVGVTAPSLSALLAGQAAAIAQGKRSIDDWLDIT